MKKYTIPEAARYLGLQTHDLRRRLRRGWFGGALESHEKEEFEERELREMEAWMEGDEVRLRVLSLGAGVQSTSMVLLQLEGRITPPFDCAYFCDPGNEAKGTYRVVADLQALCAEEGFPLHVERTGNFREDLLSWDPRKKGSKVLQPPYFKKREDGTVTHTGRFCTGNYKIEPFHRWLKGALGATRTAHYVGFRAVIGLGITVDEAHRMNAPDERWMENWYPLIEMGWSRGDCERYLEEKGWSVPKSSCLGCPFAPSSRLLELEEEDPEGLEDLMMIDDTFAEKLEGFDYDIFMDQSATRLREVHERLKVGAGQGRLFEEPDRWGNECTGFCGL